MKPKDHTRLCIGVVILGAALGPAWSARAGNLYWLRDFNDGTTQGLTVTDMGQILYGIPVSFIPFQPTNAEGALRLRFNPHPTLSGEDTGFAFDPTPLTDTSGLMLIKFTTNSHYTDATRDMQVGMLLRADPLMATPPHYHGYLIDLDDRGGIGIEKIFPDSSSPPLVVPNVTNLYLNCVGPTTIPGWDNALSPARDWWMRCDAVDDGLGGVIIRARVWPDGDPEPAEWLVTCTDIGDPVTGPPVVSGGFGVAAKEKTKNGQQPPPAGTWPADGSGDYIDIDNLSVSMPIESYCPAHCGDPICASHPDCECNVPFADAVGPAGIGKGFGSGTVDMDDFAIFQTCYTGPGGVIPASAIYCECFDRPEPGFPKGNDMIDSTDLAAFLACVTGPAIPWTASVDCPAPPQ